MEVQWIVRCQRHLDFDLTVRLWRSDGIELG